MQNPRLRKLSSISLHYCYLQGLAVCKNKDVIREGDSTPVVPHCDEFILVILLRSDELPGYIRLRIVSTFQRNLVALKELRVDNLPADFGKLVEVGATSLELRRHSRKVLHNFRTP